MAGFNLITEASAIAGLGAIDSLIIDLRGNTGGGIGALRVMSLLTPDRVPVGFALDKRRVTSNLDTAKQGFRRFSQIPTSTKALWPLALRFAPAMLTKKPIVLQTEGLGKQPFHGRVVLLVNRHTASAAEMIVAFARENSLATIVGEKTAGKLLSATSIKVGNGFRLALPTGTYHTWKGAVLEGIPIEPDHVIGFGWRDLRELAIEGKSYILWARNPTSPKVFVCEDRIPSQFMRRAICEQLGTPHLWDWRQQPLREKISQFITKWRRAEGANTAESENYASMILTGGPLAACR